MPTWIVHRPAAQPNTASRASTAKRATLILAGGQSSLGRWTFHDPASQGEPVGHGWHFDGIESRRMAGRDVQWLQRWTCDYGCKTFLWSREPEPGEYHAFDCPYWDREGKDSTPF